MTIALFILALAQQPDQDFLSCDERTDDWIVFDTGGGAGKAELRWNRQADAVREGTGALEFAFERKAGSIVALLAPVLLTNVRSIEFDVWSRATTVFALAVEDRDGAKFHHGVELQAGTWKRMKVQPGGFELSDDSPVKKPRLDAKRLGWGLGMVDIASALGVEGPNVLRIDGLRVVRDPLPATKLPAVVDGKTVEITRDGTAQGSVVVRNGGVLRITANRFVLAGSVVVEKGGFEIRGGAVSLVGRFPHDLHLSAGPDSKILFRDAVVLCNFVHGIGLFEKSRLEIERSIVASGGFTVDAREGSTALLDQARRVGEFVISKGARVTLVDSEGALLWLVPPAGAEVTLKLPDGASVDHWVPPKETGILGSIQRSRGIAWGLVSVPGSRVTVEEGELAGLGVWLSGEHEIGGVRKGTDLKLADRTLAFGKATVRTWNLYPGESAKVAVRDATFGETIVFGDARLVVEDSICDGTGGYVRVEGKAELTLRRCRLKCPVVAADEATLVLEDCTVEGPLSASGKATVRLRGTKVTGAIERLDKATIDRK
ncbi:MAG: hypothetical protein HYY17_13905 [Planctomycetes bacterium]|nr:hypothetical protein [Planctomycetota bacterium]